MRKGFRKRKSIEKIAEQKSPFFNRKESKMNEVSSSFILQKGILPKLQIGKSNDYHEKQADKVADKVVNSNQPIQKQADEEPKAKFEINKQEEEEAQAKIDLRKQEEEEEAAQAKLQKQEEEDVQAKFDLRKQEEEEEPIQTKLQRQEEEETTSAKFEIQKQEEEEQVSSKLNVQKKSEPREPGVSFEDKLKTAITGGIPLPEKIRIEMEQKLKKNFSKVRIHTDDEAIALCSEISAQAFTSGYHIFFNKGKFQPTGATGKHLLAHELTHVIQQKEE